MSAKSDQYEIDVANNINSTSTAKAERPKVSTKFPDVTLDYNGKSKHRGKRIWLEVKMNHTDNLGNTRVSYVDGKWTAAQPLDPIKKFAIEYLTKDSATQKFLQDIAKVAGLDWKNMTLPSTKGLLKKDNAVPHTVVKEYFSKRAQYILDVPNVDLGQLVTDHYLTGKAEPAYYMQAGDDFYFIGKENPLSLPREIPVLGAGGRCRGNFKMRIGVRTSFYEVQPEIKILDMGSSPYSVKPGTRKKNPFGEK